MEPFNPFTLTDTLGGWGAFILGAALIWLVVLILSEVIDAIADIIREFTDKGK